MAKRPRCSVCPDSPTLYTLYYQRPKETEAGMTTRSSPFLYCESCGNVFDKSKPAPAKAHRQA